MVTCIRKLATELMRCVHQFKYNFEDEARGLAEQLNRYVVQQNGVNPWLRDWGTRRTMLPFTDMKKAEEKSRLRESMILVTQFWICEFWDALRQLRYVWNLGRIYFELYFVI